MKELNIHCWSLGNLVSGYGDNELEWQTQSEWLNIASGIVKVEFDVMRYDSCVGYCRDADDWHFSREELIEKYVTEFTRFTYVWGALESLIDNINPPPAPSRGKINDICYYLQNRLNLNDVIESYTDSMKNLKHILKNSDVKEDYVLKRFDGADSVSVHGIGISAIYMLRNSFVHGWIGFPFPDEENRPISMYPEMVCLSTRIVLLTLQMIWLSFYKGSNILCSIEWEKGKDDKYPIEEILRKIHMKNFKYLVT